LKLTIAPKAELSAAYIIINAKKAELRFTDSGVSSRAAETGQITYIPLTDGASTQSIEFMIPGQFSIISAPVYFATTLENLPERITEFEACNRNGACEAERGEDWKNCRSDCKPIGWILFWIAVILVAFLVVYILLQEWYKRHYESYLFKDKNDLFNLIHFIDNAEKQSMSRNEMNAKLREKGWDNEQIDYAFKKYKGLRTGMWEIPVMRAFERRKMEQELEKRKNLGINPNVTPRPIVKFMPPPKVPANAPVQSKPVQPQKTLIPAAQAKTQAQPQKPPQNNAPNNKK
jgi:hypothetical protein